MRHDPHAMNEPPTTPERLAPFGHGLPPGSGAWPAGHRIGSFEFRGVVAARPTAIVYRGWDHGLEVPVALKEYLPGALARRGAYGEIGPAEPALAEAFELGLRAFIAEGRQLARCDHPSLVRVLQLLPAHGGACLVMPWHAGRPLAGLRREMPGPPDEAALRALLASLLSALHAWHRVNGVHGAVGPAAVLLLDDDRPLLLGPNLAERALARHLPPPAEAGYAAPELDGDAARAGPWSDVHALAQLARFAITGLAPAATGGEPLAAIVPRLFGGAPAARYALALLDAIDRAASPSIAERPQSIAEFAAWIDGARPARVAAAAPEIDLELDLAAPPAWPSATTSAAAADEVDLPLPDITAPPVRGPGAAAARPRDGATDGSRWPGPPDPPPTPRARPAEADPSPSGPARADAGRREPPLMPLTLPAGAGTPPAPANAPDEEPDAATVELIQRVLDSIPPAPPRRGAAEPVAPAGGPAAAPRAGPRASRAAAGVTAAALATIVGAALWWSQARDDPAAAAGTPAAATQAPAPAPAPPAAAPPGAALPSPTTTTPAPPREVFVDGPPAPAAPRPDAASPPSPAAAVTPRSACGERTPFSLYRCMQQRCADAAWARHPQCVEFRATDRVPS